MKNSSDRGVGYPQRPKVEVDNTLWDLQNSSYSLRKPNSIIALLFIQNILFAQTCKPTRSHKHTTPSPGFLFQWFNNLWRQWFTNLEQAAFLGSFSRQWFNNLQQAALDVIGWTWQNSLQIWSTAAGYDELWVWFSPIRNREIFGKNNTYNSSGTSMIFTVFIEHHTLSPWHALTTVPWW